MRHPRTTIAAAAAVLALGAGATGSAEAEAAPMAAQEPDGREIFHGKGTCFACHGPEGAGTPIGPALNDADWLHFEGRPTHDAVIELVKAGVDQPVESPSPMLPMAGVRLSDAELDAVAAYVLSLTDPGATDG